MNDLTAEKDNNIFATALNFFVQIRTGGISLASLKAAFSFLVFSHFLTECDATSFSSKCLGFMELIEVATKGYCVVKAYADPTTATVSITSPRPQLDQLYHIESYLTCTEHLRKAMIEHRKVIAKMDIAFTEANLLQKCIKFYIKVGENLGLTDENVKQNLDRVLHGFDKLNKELIASIMPTLTQPLYRW